MTKDEAISRALHDLMGTEYADSDWEIVTLAESYFELQSHNRFWQPVVDDTESSKKEVWTTEQVKKLLERLLEGVGT